jgi:hypothetical protein
MVRIWSWERWERWEREMERTEEERREGGMSPDHLSSTSYILKTATHRGIAYSGVPEV